MRRRQRPGPVVIPLRLQRFRSSEWCDPAADPLMPGYWREQDQHVYHAVRAWRRYYAAKREASR